MGVTKSAGMIFHVLPINDSFDHEKTMCACGLTIVTENGHLIMIHDSYDGREGVELTNEVLGVQTTGEHWKIIKEDEWE